MRGEPADHLRKHYMILGPELVVYDLVVFRMSLGCIPLVPAPAIPCVMAFVVAAPQGYTGMVAQTADTQAWLRRRRILYSASALTDSSHSPEAG